MFALLPPELQSVAVRASVKYAPHPDVWMAPAHAKSTGLGIECEALEMDFSELPPWEEAKRKTLPVLWKTPGTGELSFQVHPCGVAELLVNPLPAGAAHEGAIYPDGAHLTNLKEVRELLYTMQRPTIAPSVRILVFSVPLSPLLTHLPSTACLPTRLARKRPSALSQPLHTVMGAFTPDQVRTFHQCNLAASDDPAGPSAEDVRRWA
ncbi:Clavaminate synthase-like protein [Mycena venus]|uniref:Clavaminate synthase-like protein n=1 Tax=Mycena venus TaxID=2733690 RepID=A0A8H7CZH9_9AGAR|nr:Clavaminate synthase-like protein [Mycena venus]